MNQLESLVGGGQGGFCDGWHEYLEVLEIFLALERDLATILELVAGDLDCLHPLLQFLIRSTMNWMQIHVIQPCHYIV